jgi:RNA polymerase sigma factor (sigma-70 family)
VGPSRDFAVFYESAKDPCLRAVLAAGSDPATAEEVVAEAFARAYAKWSRVSKHPAPEAWVVTTALNHRVSRWRRERRELLTAGVPEARIEASQSAVDPALMFALRGLPQRQREVVALRVLLDLDTAMTARALNIAENTVGVHLHRALVSLRQALADASREGEQS